MPTFEKTRVYQYGLLPPTENAELVWNQMREGHRTYNDYVRCEITRRDTTREILSGLGLTVLEHAVAEAKIPLDKANKAVKASRLATGTREVPKPLNDALKVARKAHKKAVQAFRDKMAELGPALLPIQDEIGEKHLERRRAVYAESKVYQGTQQLIRYRVDAATKTPLYKGATPNNPKFKCGRNDVFVGHVGVQMHSFPTENVFQEDNRWVRLDHLNADAPKKNHRLRTTLHLRVGSNGQKPVWASWPMILHRPLPKGGKISWVAVTMQYVGPHAVWSVEFTVSAPCEQPKDAYANDSVSLDLGWREFPRDNGHPEIRLASWLGQDGQNGELRVPSSTIRGLCWERELASIRKKNFNEILTTLVDWLKNLGEVPDWIREASQSAKTRGEELPSSAQAIAWIAQWESQARLAALVKRWAHNRFEGDAEIFGSRPNREEVDPEIAQFLGPARIRQGPGLEGWRYHDYHLWKWETSQRRKARRNRREVYRLFAKNLASRYRVLVIEDFDLRGVAKKPKLGSKKDLDPNKKRDSNRHMVSPSELIGCCKNAFDKAGGMVVAFNPAYTSKKCNVCGEIVDTGSRLLHTCPKCSAEWDRDENARINILKLWLEHPSDAKTLVGARKAENNNDTEEVKEKKFERVRRLRVEKLARIATARNQASTSA
jgi:hypothetical protein